VLAVLIDREGRSLPIQPDFSGLKLNVSLDERVEVHISDKADIKDTISIEP
jgi:pyrimidine operon attenuation protein / uracil phosphoribosyltransferase